MEIIKNYFFQLLFLIELTLISSSLLLKMKSLKVIILLVNFLLGISLIVFAHKFADPGFVDVVVVILGFCVLIVSIIQSIVINGQVKKGRS